MISPCSVASSSCDGADQCKACTMPRPGSGPARCSVDQAHRQRPQRYPPVTPVLGMAGKQQHSVPLRCIELSAFHLPRRGASLRHRPGSAALGGPASCSRSTYAKQQMGRSCSRAEAQLLQLPASLTGAA